MKKLILRFLAVILSIHVAGAVVPLFTSTGAHGAHTSTDAHGTPSTPPPPPPPPPPTSTGGAPAPMLGGGSSGSGFGGPPSGMSSGGGGCGSGSHTSTVSPPPPPDKPAGEIASTDKGPVILPPDDGPYKGPPLPPPPGSEDNGKDGDKKKKDDDKKDRKDQQALDKLTTELAANLKGDGGDVSDETLTNQVNTIQNALKYNHNLKVSPEFTKDLNQYDKNLKDQRAADRQEYQIYHNATIKLEALGKDARKQAVTDITGAMVGEISKLNVAYGPLGILFTAAEQGRRARNAEVIANDFKNITNAEVAGKKADYLRGSMSQRVKSIDRRLKILQPLMK